MRALFFLAALTACDAPVALIGSWSDALDGAIFTFKGDGSWAYDDTSTDSTTHCTDVFTAGGSYTALGSMLTMRQPSPSTLEISGCTDSTMNMAKGLDPLRRTLGGVFTWTVSGNTLTLDPGSGAKRVLTKLM